MNTSNKCQVLLKHSPPQLCESGPPKYHCWQVKWSCRGEKGDFRNGAPWEQSCLLFLFIFDSPITDDLPHGINCDDFFWRLSDSANTLFKAIWTFKLLELKSMFFPLTDQTNTWTELSWQFNLLNVTVKIGLQIQLRVFQMDFWQSS